MKFEPTHEQREILQAFLAGKNVKIHAFAGTGKTATLFYLASHTDRQGLYFAFNKRTAEEAKKKMPSNVVSATIHSFAWKWASSTFAVEKLIRNPTHNLIRQHVTIPKIAQYSDFKTVSTILRTVGSYCQSTESQVTVRHLPWQHDAYIFDQDILKQYENDFVDAAQTVWKLMSEKEAEIPIGHDGYLKLWALSKPELEYDFLFIDEAQDLNPVMLDILDGFSGQKIIVGDSQQQIYAWRGAANAMSKEFAAEDLYLTKTFRFGNELSEIANNVLKGLGAKKSIVSASGHGTMILSASEELADAYLFRKNTTLLQEAVGFYRAGLNYHIVDPNKNIALAVEDYFRLNEGQWGRSQTFEGFNSWDAVVRLAKSEDNNPFRSFVELFELYDPSEIKLAVEASKKTASIKYPSLSTIHQAKGFEWSIVQLSGDLALDFQAQSFEQKAEELRLLYVGLTRAEKTLILPEELLRFCRSVTATWLDRFAVIDLETTGLSPTHGDRITEVGIVLIEEGKVVDRFQSFVNPMRPIPAYVQDLTGITDSMVADAPVSSVVLSRAMQFVGNRPLVAHNASFEQKFLNSELSEIAVENKVNLLCTMLLSRRVFPELDSYTLEKLVSRFRLPVGQAHRALSDAEMTAHLLMRLKKEVLDAAPEGYQFTPENFLRLTKLKPNTIREIGLAKAIQVGSKSFKETSFAETVFVAPPKTVEPRNAYNETPQTMPIIAAQPPLERQESVQHSTTAHENFDRSDSLRRLLRTAFRKLILTTNWIVFGFLPVVALIVVSDTDFEGREIMLVVSVISLLFGFLVHRKTNRWLVSRPTASPLGRKPPQHDT